jgi:ATP-dependent Clp protease ATP-binding subunit ClpB
LAVIQEEMTELRKKLSSLREQWEAEKLGLGDVADVQRRMDEARVKVDQQTAAIREQQAAGRVDEKAYQKLYELDQELKKLAKHLEEAAEKQAVGENGTGGASGTRRLLRQEVGPDEIAEVVSAWTGVPVSRMLEKERAKLLVLEERLHQRVVGQDEAVRAVANAVRRSRSGLQDPNRPIGSFIFCGPTGVGKTELCKALAVVLFDDEHAMIRIDMSEYMEKHTVSRLIGAPPGYVGYEEGGMLTEAVRRRPYSVVLLDEIEKAHRDVFNILLQVLDDGRLSDSHGHTVDFTNTIIVMTSNVGSQMIQEIFEQGGKYDEMRAAVMESLQARFLPEFLNRIDETIVFKPLARSEIRKIVDIQIERLATLLQQRGFGLEVSEPARAEIANRGYDPAMGARPLKRVIQQELQNPLATELLKGQWPEDSTIRIDYDGQDFTFEATGGGNGARRKGGKPAGDEILSAEVV